MLDRSTGAARDGRPRSPGPEMTGAPLSEGTHMAKLDRLLMRADIIHVEDERPDLDHTIVRGLYEHFVDMQGRQPSFDEFRDYVDRITSSIEWLDLWEQFSPHVPSVEERAAHEEATPQRDPSPEGRVTVARHSRGPGRPGWTAELFWARYRDALGRTEPPHSYRALALQFQTLDGPRGIDPDHLRKLVRRFGPPPG